MKNLFIASTVLVLSMSCNKEQPKNYALLSGNISNYAGETLTINSMDRKLSDTLTISENGVFKDTLRLATADYVLYDGKNPTLLHVSNGSELQVNYDSNNYKNTIQVTGKGSEITNYLYDKKDIEQGLRGQDNMYLLEEAEFKAKANELKDSLTAYITSFEGISQDYKNKEKRNINYAYLSTLNKYKPYHSYYTKQPDFKVSEGFLSELNGFDYNNEADFLFSKDYKDLIRNHYQESSNALVKSDSLSFDMAYLKMLATIENETIKNSLLAEAGKSNISFTKDLEKFYELFMGYSTDENDKADVTEIYNKLKLISKGSPSPKFVDYENYKGGTTSLDDLKGKYVYVDVWATWCGPCKAEIPHLKKVEEQYHGKNIAFVSISVDEAKNYDKWRAMVEEKELGGIQLLADNDWKSSFVQGYQIKGIPRFILIDTEGNIISSNAPRPSNPELIKLFDEYKI